MSLYLFNTLTKKKEKFVPISKSKVGLYTCGPTVYNSAHIGNLRAYVFEDVLKRTLFFNGFKVKHVLNITDVGHLTSDADEGEDKMTKGLRRDGLPLTLAGMKKLAQKYTNLFVKDIKRLNVILPDEMPKASENIAEDIDLIEKLDKNGFIYQIEDGVYFDTSKLPDYGQLVNGKIDIDEGHQRIKKGGKKNNKDFALWKFNNKLGWDSKYGKGFPGWHIECSAMATKYLGEKFDIHCGGKEHIAVHHTNEIAQSEAAWGKKPWVKYWLHHEWLELGGKKMAKSGENFITLSLLEEKSFSPLDFRYLCLGTHYRKPLMFNYGALEGASQARKKLEEKMKEFKSESKIIDLKSNLSNPKKINNPLIKKYQVKFSTEVNDDLNTPQALATLWEVIKDKQLNEGSKYYLLLQFDRIFGLNLGLLKKVQKQLKVPLKVKQLAEERLIARQNKDWKTADKIRQEVTDFGYVV